MAAATYKTIWVVVTKIRDDSCIRRHNIQLGDNTVDLVLMDKELMTEVPAQLTERYSLVCCVHATPFSHIFIPMFKSEYLELCEEAYATTLDQVLSGRQFAWYSDGEEFMAFRPRNRSVKVLRAIPPQIESGFNQN